MDTRTGSIKMFESAALAKSMGFDKPLSLEEVDLLINKTPTERVEWAKIQPVRHAPEVARPKVAGPPPRRFKVREKKHR